MSVPQLHIKDGIIFISNLISSFFSISFIIFWIMYSKMCMISYMTIIHHTDFFSLWQYHCLGSSFLLSYNRKICGVQFLWMVDISQVISLLCTLMPIMYCIIELVSCMGLIFAVKRSSVKIVTPQKFPTIWYSPERLGSWLIWTVCCDKQLGVHWDASLSAYLPVVCLALTLLSLSIHSTHNYYH